MRNEAAKISLSAMISALSPDLSRNETIVLSVPIPLAFLPMDLI